MLVGDWPMNIYNSLHCMQKRVLKTIPVHQNALHETRIMKILIFDRCFSVKWANEEPKVWVCNLVSHTPLKM